MTPFDDELETRSNTGEVPVVVHTGFVTSVRERLLTVTFRIMVALIVLMSLLISLTSGHASDEHYNKLFVQFEAARTKLEQVNATQSDTLNCGRRYQDAVDSSSANVQITTSELVVILAKDPATHPERQEQADAKIVELEVATEEARLAVNAKVKYNEAGSPLPCEIENVEPLPP
jgi:hypothetical protein